MTAPDFVQNPLGLPIGCQTYPVRDRIEKDFAGTLKELASAGFQKIELCSPVGYADFGFSGLAKYQPADLKRIWTDLGLTCDGSHFMMKELREDLAGRIDWTEKCGMTQMFVPTLTGPPNPTLDDVKRLAEEFNKMGEEAAKAGILLGLHNEDFELTYVNGKRTYDLLLDLLEPKLITFQFQISTISRGYDAAEYFTKYPGRFSSMHAQDWSRSLQKTVALGQGDLDWSKIFNAAKVGGVKNYFVELNLDAMRISVSYLRGLKV